MRRQTKMSSTSNAYLLGATSRYTISPSRVSETTTAAGIFSSKTTAAEMPAIRMAENLSEEDREARRKGFRLVARMEHLAQTDEGFRRWLQVGFDQIEAGESVTFSEDGWEE